VSDLDIAALRERTLLTHAEIHALRCARRWAATSAPAAGSSRSWTAFDQLRAQRDTLLAAASAICRDDHDDHYVLGARGLRTLRAAIRNCKETQ